MEYTFEMCSFDQVDKKFDREIYLRSSRNRGYIWSDFIKRRTCSRSKIVICRKNEQIVAWGIRFKIENKIKYAIMAYVTRSNRKKGLGTIIFKKLMRGLPKSKIEVYPNSTNNHFFKKLR